MVYVVGFFGFSVCSGKAIFGSTVGGAGISVIPHTTRGLRLDGRFATTSGKRGAGLACGGACGGLVTITSFLRPPASPTACYAWRSYLRDRRTRTSDSPYRA